MKVLNDKTINNIKDLSCVFAVVKIHDLKYEIATELDDVILRLNGSDSFTISHLSNYDEEYKTTNIKIMREYMKEIKEIVRRDYCE